MPLIDPNNLGFSNRNLICSKTKSTNTAKCQLSIVELVILLYFNVPASTEINLHNLDWLYQERYSNCMRLSHTCSSCGTMDLWTM